MAYPNPALKLMRAEIKKFFIDTVSIYSVAITYDAFGKPTRTRTLQTTLKGQIADVSGKEQDLISALLNEGTDKIETAKLVLPYGTAVNVDHEVDTADGKTWKIVHANTSHTLTTGVEVLLYRRLVDTTQVP